MTKKTNLNIGKKFPEVAADSLVNTRISIPDSAKGKVTLVTVSFLHQRQAQLEAWLEPFIARFGTTEGFTFYEVPIINVGYLFMRFMIDSAMRAAIPKKKHRHVVIMYGDVESYVKALNLDPRNGYAFLLDRKGIIRWQGQGYPSPETLKELFDIAEKLAK